MKILSWNVRGLGGVEKRRSIRDCIRKYRPDVIIFLETKKEVMKSRLIRSAIGCESSEWCIIPAVGTSGRVLMAWNPLMIRKVNEVIGIFSKSIHLVNCLLRHEWTLIGVYGPTTQNRSTFWEELSATKRR